MCNNYVQQDNLFLDFLLSKENHFYSTFATILDHFLGGGPAGGDGGSVSATRLFRKEIDKFSPQLKMRFFPDKIFESENSFPNIYWQTVKIE
jgi:hypothetical protein